jgi:hypothetical protein
MTIEVRRALRASQVTSPLLPQQNKTVITRSRFSRDPGDPILRRLPNWITRTLRAG